MIGVFGIIIALGLLMYFAYRGVSVIILTPILALLAVVIGGSMQVLPYYTNVYMSSLASFVATNFPIFLLGAIFGVIMDKSGAAKTIAIAIASKLGKEKAIIAVVLACAVLTYGGVSLFVVAFAVYPIALQLFREAGIPKRLIPGSIALGSFTFTMTALPGTPQIQNAIPMKYFGTDSWAAPTLGVVAALIMCVGGCIWLMYRAKKAMVANEPFSEQLAIAQEEELIEQREKVSAGKFSLALVPILIVLVANFCFSKFIFVESFTNWAFLSEAPFNIGSIADVGGNWSLIVSLLIAVLTGLFINYKQFDKPVQIVNEGANNSLIAIINTAAAVGFGKVIGTLPAFTVVKDGILGISDNPLVAEGISVSTLAGITGSASGGMSIALESLGANLLDLANQAGLSPEVLHRIATIACGGLDTLPHNGAVITLLAVCGLTHKKSYFDIMMVSLVIPTIALVVCIILGSLGIV